MGKIKIKNQNQLMTTYLGFFSTLIVNDFLLGLGTKCTSGSLIILLWSMVFPPRSIVFVVLLLLGQVFMHPDQETIKAPLEDSVNMELSIKLKQQENTITGPPVSSSFVINFNWQIKEIVSMTQLHQYTWPRKYCTNRLKKQLKGELNFDV